MNFLENLLTEIYAPVPYMDTAERTDVEAKVKAPISQPCKDAEHEREREGDLEREREDGMGWLSV